MSRQVIDASSMMMHEMCHAKRNRVEASHHPRFRLVAFPCARDVARNFGKPCGENRDGNSVDDSATRVD